MGEPVEMRVLRHRAARLVEEIRELPGFAERLADVAPVPVLAQRWRWDFVVSATEYDSWKPGSFRWAAPQDPHGRPWVVAGEGFGDSPSLDPVVGPVGDELATEAERDLLLAYRSNVLDFASTYLIGVRWGARAVHDALRLNEPIRLPPVPERMVQLPLAEPFVLDPKLAIPHRWCIELAEFLLKTAAEAAANDYRPTGPIPSEEHWTEVVESVRLALSGGRSAAMSGTSRSRISRIKRWLELAVTDFRGGVLHPGDEPNYVEARRSRELDARDQPGTTGTDGTA